MDEFADFARICDLGVDVLHARFITHAYARHSHDTLVIGIFEAGAVRYRYRGGIERCATGSLMVFDPEEAHDGIPEPGGFVKRVCYVPIAVVDATLGSHGWFGRSRIDDRSLWSAWQSWLASAPGAVERLGMETEFASLLERTFLRSRVVAGAASCKRTTLLAVRERLEDEPEANVSLAELAATSGLSRAEFVRQFTTAFGLPPHAYVVNLRLRRARRLLERGLPPADVAVACGFCDQSHLSRRFLRAYGVAPGAFLKSARSSKTGPHIAV